MANQDSGDKTEKATPKKLREARKKGDIARSRDITNALSLLLACVLVWQLAGALYSRLAVFMSDVMSHGNQPILENLYNFGGQAISLLLIASGVLLIPLVLVGVLVEFMQTGPILTLDKIKPDLTNISPLRGLQRMFSMDSLFELLKSVLKTAVIFAIGIYTAYTLLPSLIMLPDATPATLLEIVSHGVKILFLCTVAIFVVVSVFDLAYQKHAYAKKMRMSLQDIKQEHKDNEGDPQVKNQRRQLASEWSQEGATQSTREANVLVVNPTHVAIALEYDPDTTPIPIVTARGQDDIAKAMREAATQAQVPVLRNIKLARQLLSDTKEGEAIPKELFDIVAQVILWADSTRQRISDNEEGNGDHSMAESTPAPGEDLTQYQLR